MNESTISISDPRKKVVTLRDADSPLQTHVTYSKVYVVAVGNLAKGFQFYGPFTNLRLAIDWAADNLKTGETRSVYPMNHVRGVRGEVEITA